MQAPPRFDFTGLSDAERLLIAGELLDLIHSPMPPLSASQITELEREDERADADAEPGEPWESVKARLMLNR